MSNERRPLDSIRFTRGPSLWQAAMRGLGVVLVAMTFALLGKAVGLAGSLTSIAFPLVALVIIANGLGYAELAVSLQRPGNAITLIREGGGRGWLEFLSGWSLVLAGLALTGLLAQGAATHLGQLLVFFGLPSLSTGMLAMGIAALTALMSSRRWQRKRRIPLTLPLLLLLTLLALASVPRLRETARAALPGDPAAAATLLLIVFAGLEIASGNRSEMRQRKMRFPLIWLGAPALVAVLGAILAALATHMLGTLDPAVMVTPLASLGSAAAGPTAGMLILAFGTIALVLATGRALEMVMRHLYEMARSGFWPDWLLQPQRGAARLTLLIGLLAVACAWVPLSLLAHSGGLLYLFTLMAVNLTLALRPRQPNAADAAGAQRRFALPFHPWIPALVLAIDLLLIPLWGWHALWSLGALLVGGMVYLVYGRGRRIEAQDGVTVFRPPGEERAKPPFQVLVPIANPATIGALLHMAGWLAQAKGGQIVALQVVVVPDPVPLEAGRLRAQAGRALLENALELANREGLSIRTMTRVARNVSQGIIEAATEEGVDLILLGSPVQSHGRSASLGPIVEEILRNASCDVLVMQGRDLDSVKSILIPTSGGPHAQAATRLAGLLAETCGAAVTLLCIQPGPSTEQQQIENQCRLAETAAALPANQLAEQKVIQAANVVQAIVQEAPGYDLVLLGVSEESLMDRLVFGSIPLQIAARVPHAALVQADRGLPQVWAHRMTHMLLGILPTLERDEQATVHHDLSKGAQPGIDYFVLIVLSCIIAALGLLLDSPAVVIGAMLVAPLMSPIMAFSLGLVLGDLRLIRFAVESIFKGVALAAIIAAFIGLLSPLKGLTGEMLARSRPNLLDMVVALASGMAGAYALARKDVSAALPGVAIAAALMPPLATVGLSLSLGAVHVAGGAFLLFLTNIAAISLAGGVVFLLLGIRPRSWGPASRRQLRQRLIASFVLLMVIAFPLALLMGGTIREATQEEQVRIVLNRQLAAMNGELVELEVTRAQEGLDVTATVRSPHAVDRAAVDGMAAVLGNELGQPVQLELAVLLVTRSGDE